MSHDKTRRTFGNNLRQLAANACLMLLCRPLQIQLQQPRQNLLNAHTRIPAIGGEDGGVEFFVGEVEPGGAFVVEVGERALLQFGCSPRPWARGGDSGQCRWRAYLGCRHSAKAGETQYL
jgi:hypothetical protein